MTKRIAWAVVSAFWSGLLVFSGAETLTRPEISEELARTSPAVVEAGEMAAFATFHAAGIGFHVSGDHNRNAQALVEFRKTGDLEWRQALPLARIDDTRFAGSLFSLVPDTPYEVRIRLEDADGVDRQPDPIAFRTSAEHFPAGTGRTWFVEPGKTGNGSRERPFGSIQEAVDLAGPGDTVLVRKGIYRENVSIRNKTGAPEAFILIKGEPGATISGALEDLERIGQNRWQPEANQVASIVISDRWNDVGYVAAGEERLYRYWSLEDLEVRKSGVKGGWYWERPRLYAALPDGENPNEMSMRVAVRPFGFHIQNSSRLILEGFDLGFFGMSDRRARGYGILVEDSSQIIIRRNRIHHCNHGIRTAGAGIAAWTAAGSHKG